MAEVMHDILLDSTKAAFVVASFVDVFVDEVMIINNTQWFFIHLYMVQQWKRILIFLCVQTMGMSTTSNNIFSLMFKYLVEYGGLGLEKLVGKLINIRCDGNSVFYNHKSRVTLHFKEKVAPFVIEVHYFAHKTNFIIVTLLNVPLVHQLELLLQNLYTFFVHNPKEVC
jgi:hypothetical protein